MGTELVTGISTTNGEPFNPLMTFVWDVKESGDHLLVTVSYGIGSTTSNFAKARIGLGSTEPVTIAGKATDSAAQVGGSLTAAWANNNQSYVVTFSGFMFVVSLNNAFSSDQNGAPADSAPIIVAAYLAA